MIGRGFVVQNLGESSDMRSVGADDAQPQRAGTGSRDRAETSGRRIELHFRHCTLWWEARARAASARSMDLATSLTYVKGVGPARAAMLEAKG